MSRPLSYASGHATFFSKEQQDQKKIADELDKLHVTGCKAFGHMTWVVNFELFLLTSGHIEHHLPALQRYCEINNIIFKYEGAWSDRGGSAKFYNFSRTNMYDDDEKERFIIKSIIKSIMSGTEAASVEEIERSYVPPPPARDCRIL